MIKTHTAQSLGKYLGKKVIITDERNKSFSGKLMSIELYYSYTEVGVKVEEALRLNGDNVDSGEIIKGLSPASVKPILKTYKKLKDEDLLYIYEKERYDKAAVLREKVTFDFSFFWVGEGRFKPEVMERLIERGFGAIQNPESPTGYVDLFGYVCEVER